jgi:hypothetical protein
VQIITSRYESVRRYKNGEQTKSGSELTEGIINQRRTFTTSGVSGSFRAFSGGQSTSTFLGRYDAGLNKIYALDARGQSGADAALFIGNIKYCRHS